MKVINKEFHRKREFTHLCFGTFFEAFHYEGVASFENNKLSVVPLSESDSLYTSITMTFTDSGLTEVNFSPSDIFNKETGFELMMGVLKLLNNLDMRDET